MPGEPQAKPGGQAVQAAASEERPAALPYVPLGHGVADGEPCGQYEPAAQRLT